MHWATRKHNISEEELNMPVNGAAAIAEAAEKAFHRYQIVTLKWDDNEYLAVKDTQSGGIICTEHVRFVAYPECVFLEPEDEHGRTYLETICKALNNEH
tara:strand:- start:519 stop:815 length:297 start_codon:yes stop_codon:yes gene_type:complete